MIGKAHSLTFDEYRDLARQFAIYPNIGSNVQYATLGLVGEAGEIANKVKKMMRDHDGVITDETRGALKSELGDVLWYAAMLAVEIGVSFEDVAEGNLNKLNDRALRGRLQGAGDER